MNDNISQYKKLINMLEEMDSKKGQVTQNTGQYSHPVQQSMGNPIQLQNLNPSKMQQVQMSTQQMYQQPLQAQEPNLRQPEGKQVHTQESEEASQPIQWLTK